MIVARSKLQYLRFTGSALSSDSLTLTMREVWTMMGLFWGLSNIHYNHCNIHLKVEEVAPFYPNLQMFYQFHGLLKSIILCRECIVISESTSGKDYLDLLIFLISNQTISLWAICQNPNLGRILSVKDNHQNFKGKCYISILKWLMLMIWRTPCFLYWHAFDPITYSSFMLFMDEKILKRKTMCYAMENWGMCIMYILWKVKSSECPIPKAIALLLYLFRQMEELLMGSIHPLWI